MIESCILNLPHRQIPIVICISSQVGCPFKCSFCSNRYRPFVRNLTAVEMVQQVESSLDLLSSKPSTFDVTFMAIGEPLSNSEEVIKSIKILIEKYPILHKINISTLLPNRNLYNFLDFSFKNKIHIQFSLHSPNNKERKKLFRYQLLDIEKSLKMIAFFANATKDYPCINYVLINNINDLPEQAQQLVSIIKNKELYVKISSYNTINYSNYEPSNQNNTLNFIKILKQSRIQYKFFDSNGKDIKAGCGQMVSSMEINDQKKQIKTKKIEIY